MSARQPETKRPILTAIDFSPCSESALIWAAGLAARLRAPLVVLHVVHDRAEQPGYYDQVKKRKKHLRRIEEAAAEMMSDFLAHMKEKNPGLLDEMESRLVIGLPVTRILEVAERIGAQMIVMGSQGRTGLSHLLLGSKAERVVQLAPVPVTIVKNEKVKKKKRG